MLDTLFGEGQSALKVVFALIVVLGLLVLAFWLLRRFGGERLGNTAARGRQPRLAVVDAAMVDGRRRLILIRRDNIEHLLIIGGPTDVVIEQNIVRAAGAPREAPPPRPPGADALPRAAPYGEGTMWPLQPEPAPRLEPTRLEPTRPEPTRPEPTRPEPARLEPTRPEARFEPPARAEPALRPEPAPRPEPPLRPEPRPQRPPPVVEEQWSAEPEPPPPRERRPRIADPLAGLAEELSRAPAPAPAEAEPTEPPIRPPLRRAPRPPQGAPPAPTPPPAPAADAPFNPSADQNLAEMAQRLEAALRRPAKSEGGGQDAARPEPAEIEEPPARAIGPTEGARPARGAPPRPDAKPAPQKSLYDSLEQEMASLLGRPNSKP